MSRIRSLLGAPIVAGALLVGAVVPAGAAGAAPPSKTIAQVLIAKSSTAGFDRNLQDYDVLIKAAQTADLDNALNGPNDDLTVFAPNDRAFVRTARSLGYTGFSEAGAWTFLAAALTDLGNGNPVPVLKNILLYHVASGSLAPLHIANTGKVDTLLGASFKVRFVRLVDKAPNLPDPYFNVDALNIKANNGVIHGITRVLIPVDIG
jgi:uncharacterized surface protein with fasciclin (FAS1) repeats